MHASVYLYKYYITVEFNVVKNRLELVFAAHTPITYLQSLTKDYETTHMKVCLYLPSPYRAMLVVMMLNFC